MRTRPSKPAPDSRPQTPDRPVYPATRRVRVARRTSIHGSRATDARPDQRRRAPAPDRRTRSAGSVDEQRGDLRLPPTVGSWGLTAGWTLAPCSSQASQLSPEGGPMSVPPLLNAARPPSLVRHAARLSGRAPAAQQGAALPARSAHG